MKAVIINDYGGREVLAIADIPRPSPWNDEILVRVHAAGINPKDTFIRKGYFKQFTGDPESVRLGFDYAGEVAEIGGEVENLHVGDPVYGGLEGWQGGACAEFLSVKSATLAKKPKRLSFEEAASMPIAALTALQGLRDEGAIQAGYSVCINGASGGVGAFAIQIAKLYGAHATAISRRENHDLLAGFGADQCLDYREVDVAQLNQRYDIFFDVFGNRPFEEITPILKQKGIWISTVLKRHVYDSVASTKHSDGKKARLVMVKSKREDLDILSRWSEASKLKPLIHAIYPMDQIGDAHAQQETKHTKGKVVLTIP